MPLPAPSTAADQTAAIQAYLDSLSPGATITFQSGGAYRVDTSLVWPPFAAITVSAPPTEAIIHTHWPRAVGTLTAVDNTTFTITDATKSWTPGQFVFNSSNGDRLIMTSGPRLGKSFRITANGATTATLVGNWGAGPLVGDSYVILRDGTYVDPVSGKRGGRNICPFIFSDLDTFDVGYLDVRGSNAARLFVSDYEGAHAFKLKHCHDFHLHHLRGFETWGDGVFFIGNDGHATDADWTHDFEVDHVDLVGIGRQGMTPNGILRGNIHDFTMDDVNRSGFDCEPASDAIGGGVRDSQITDGVFDNIGNAWFAAGTKKGKLEGLLFARHRSNTQPVNIDVNNAASATIRRRDLRFEDLESGPGTVGSVADIVYTDGVSWKRNRIHYQNSKGSTALDIPTLDFVGCTAVEMIVTTYDELVHAARKPNFAAVIQVDVNADDDDLAVYAPPNFNARWTKAGVDLPPSDCGIYVNTGTRLAALPGQPISIVATALTGGVPTVIAEAGALIDGYAPFTVRTNLFGVVTIRASNPIDPPPDPDDPPTTTIPRTKRRRRTKP